MILFRVYSLRKKKIGIFILLAFLFIMILFLLWPNWEERAVFNALREEITLIIPPGQPSVVYLNEERIGQTRETPYIYTINADDTVRIRLEPVAGNSDLTPVEKVLSFESGKLI